MFCIFITTPRAGSNISFPFGNDSLRRKLYMSSLKRAASPFSSLPSPSPKTQCFELSKKCSSNVNCKVPKDPEGRHLLGNWYLRGIWNISSAHSFGQGPKHRKSKYNKVRQRSQSGEAAEPARRICVLFSQVHSSHIGLQYQRQVYFPLITWNRKVTVYPKQITCCHLKTKK